MLTMSDSPDAGSLDPERSLLLGYPLSSGDFYVVSMTWLAPEVERPGCVWTHSLLLDADTQEIPNPAQLLSLFKRPHHVSDAEGYETPLSPPSDKKPPTPKWPSVLETLLWSLYQPPLQPVDLRSEALEHCDGQAFLLELWGQQWPELRAAFSFAQAPRIARRIDRVLLDLQITERPQRGSWDAGPGPAPARTVVKPVGESIPLWSAGLAADLQRSGPLREFLWRHGPQAEPSRGALWALASLWATLGDGSAGSGAAEVAIEILNRAFPDPEEAIELKRAILTPGDVQPHVGRVDEPDLLVAFARLDLPDGLSRVDLDLEGRAKRLPGSDEAGARKLAEALPAKLGDAGKLIASGIASGLTKAQISDWSKEDPDAIATLVNRSPTLAADGSLWKSVAPTRFWPLVRNPRASQERRRAMLAGILTAHSQQFVEKAFESWPDAGELFLDLLDSGTVKWQTAALMERVERGVALRWLKQNGPSPPVVSVLLEAWKPKQLARIPAAEWAALQDLGEKLDDYTLSLLLVAATNPDSGLGATRAITNYEAISARKGLGKRAQRHLLGAAGAGKDTSAKDAAALLLNRAVLSAGWHPRELLGIGDPKALRRVLVADDSGEIVRCLVDELGEIELPQEQRKVIFEAVMQTKDHNALHKIISAGRKYIPWF